MTDDFLWMVWFNIIPSNTISTKKVENDIKKAFTKAKWANINCIPLEQVVSASYFVCWFESKPVSLENAFRLLVAKIKTADVFQIQVDYDNYIIGNLENFTQNPVFGKKLYSKGKFFNSTNSILNMVSTKKLWYNNIF